MSPWVVAAVFCVVDLFGVRVEAGGRLRGLPSAPLLPSFLLAGLSPVPQFSCSLAPDPVRAGLARPCLLSPCGFPTCTFAGPHSLPHLLACIGLRPCWPGLSLLMPSFTLACQLHCHSHPPIPHTPTPCTCFDLRSTVFICACLVSIAAVVVAVTHIVSTDLIKCLAYLVMYLALLLPATTANTIVSIEDTYKNFMCCGM